MITKLIIVLKGGVVLAEALIALLETIRDFID
ncbi:MULTISPECIES: DinQ-like type I toxin DqlB [Enterobacter]|nr:MULTISPECIES: DinQ-like type I toxin DqlB [Enterobacter]MDO6168697.1 DinQ-like type I toxin DqlB [Enterobacter hormaechei]MDO6172964.1 DinQ-like type I toxin DqlB [Enterobacter hormaechei]